MKVAAVSRFQENIKEINKKDVKRHANIPFEFDEEKREIKLFFDKTQKQIGFIDFDIRDHLYDDMYNNPDDYKIELASIMKVPNGKHTGLQARINYIGENRVKVSEIFNDIYEDSDCAPIIYPPSTPQSPESILKTTLKYEEQINGTQAKNDMDFIVNSIAKEIKSDKNKNILILGHKDPDGDCIACVLGMKNAIELMGKNKNVDCSIDDRIPLLFGFVPGIKQIKMPEKASLINSLDASIKKSEADNSNSSILKKIRTNIEKNIKNLPEQKKYDLVILMDVAAPSRLGYKYAKYIDPQKTKIIFIDHHPKRLSEWEKDKNKTNIDMKKVNSDHLSWIADRVPAAAILVSAIAGKLNPQLNDKNVYDKSSSHEKSLIKNMAVAILTGVHTDTSSYSRSGNLYTEDMLLPRYERPKYNPAGVAKWFSMITDHTVTRNYIESQLDTQDYKLKKIKNIMKETLPEKCHRNEKLQLNYMKIEKEYLDDLWLKCAQDYPEVTFKDVIGLIKYSSAFRSLKRVDTYGKRRDSIPYDDSIAYIITQSAKKDEINSNCKISSADTISFSFRSKRGTNHAAILASLFEGGGHGAAAGGRILGKEINFDTKLLVLVNGKVEKSPKVILEALNKNFEVEHSSLPEEDKKIKTIKVVKSPFSSEGKKATELIEDIVREIRKNSNLETDIENGFSTAKL